MMLFKQLTACPTLMEQMLNYTLFNLLCNICYYFLIIDVLPGSHCEFLGSQREGKEGTPTS